MPAVPFPLVAAALVSLIVVEPAANLFSRPDRAADVVTQAIYGTAVERLELREGWVRVRMPDGYEGWMPAAAAVDAGPEGYPRTGRAARVDALFAMIYHEPDVTRRAPFLTVPYDTRLDVAAEPGGEERRWIGLRLADGQPGWVQRGDVSFDTRPLTAEETIALARRFLGLPYLWGGTSSFGFDCSGLTQLLCRRRGIGIPRDAAPQSQWEGMEPVRREDLRPGDLVYFGQPGGRVSHTGMYIGGGEFIHATSYLRPAVQISRLDDPHWDALLAGCRRLRGQR